MLLLFEQMHMGVTETVDPPSSSTSGYAGWGFPAFTASLFLIGRFLGGVLRG